MCTFIPSWYKKQENRKQKDAGYLCAKRLMRLMISNNHSSPLQVSKQSLRTNKHGIIPRAQQWLHTLVTINNHRHLPSQLTPPL
eukprot:15363666-Ditylum_brightwellii.AAC.1